MKRILLIVGITLAVVAAASGVAYTVGVARISDSAAELGAEPAPTPAPASKPAAEPATQAAAPEEGTVSSAATQEVPPPDPNSPFAKDIPGCVCHSDDPKQVADHAVYRMNQCAGCHQGGVPTGQ